LARNNAVSLVGCSLAAAHNAAAREQLSSIVNFTSGEPHNVRSRPHNLADLSTDPVANFAAPDSDTTALARENFGNIFTTCSPAEREERATRKAFLLISEAGIDYSLGPFALRRCHIISRGSFGRENVTFTTLGSDQIWLFENMSFHALNKIYRDIFDASR